MNQEKELLEKVKEQFAKRHGYPNYEAFLVLEEDPSDIISILFAKEFAKAELEKVKPKWISVDERLPKHLELVLIYVRTGNTYTGVINKAGGLNEWHSQGLVNPEVTHWMPLPESPLSTKE